MLDTKRCQTPFSGTFSCLSADCSETRFSDTTDGLSFIVLCQIRRFTQNMQTVLIQVRHRVEQSGFFSNKIFLTLRFSVQLHVTYMYLECCLQCAFLWSEPPSFAQVILHLGQTLLHLRSDSKNDYIVSSFIYNDSDKFNIKGEAGVRFALIFISC